RYRIASAAPGSFDAPAIAGPGPFSDRLTGEWQEDGSGYSIELRIARADTPDQMIFDVHDSALANTTSAAPLALLGYNDVTATLLERLAPDHVRVRMVSSDGWLVAAGGSLDVDAAAAEDQGWLAGFIYRHLLA